MDDFSSKAIDTSRLNHSDLARAFVAASEEIKKRQKGDPDPYGQVISQQQNWLIPHQYSYAAVYNWFRRYYYNYFDESLVNSTQNSLAMRRDGLIHELLRHRQLPTVSLPFTIECDDEEDPGQVRIKKELTQIINRLPYFQRLKLQLLEAIFYGKSGSQVFWTRKKIGGKERVTVGKHMPLMGDKIVYGWGDNSPDDVPGILIYKGAPIYNDPRAQKYIRPVDKGPAFFLENEFFRDQFVIHEFEPTDTDYLFESEKALAIHGLGMRDRMYWIWNMRAELLSWDLNALQRVGANGMLFAFYQQGDDAARKAVLEALQSLVQFNVAAFPRNFQGDPTSIINRMDPSPVGYDVLFQLINHLEEIMRRAFLGQNLSSQSASTGLGSGVADFQAGTFQNIVMYDAGCLGETINEQLVSNIIKFNTWEYKGKFFRGEDLPFSLEFKIQVERENVLELIQAASQLVAMGVPLDMEDLRDKAGFVAPKNRATTVGGPQQQGQLPGKLGQLPVKQATEPSLSRSSTPPAKRADESEHFGVSAPGSRFTLAEEIAYELANVPSDSLQAGWYHAADRRVWVSIYLHTTIDTTMRLANALRRLVGDGNFKVVAEEGPPGDGWTKLDTSGFVIEPEWYSKNSQDAPEKFARDPGDPGVMISLTVPRKIADELAIEGGEDPAELHVTLAYLGKLSVVGEHLNASRQVCEMLASNSPALSGWIRGIGRFTASETSDGKDVAYLNVDVPRLTDFRSELVHVLRLAGIPFSEKHGFTPHITLAYIDPDASMPRDRQPSVPVSFGYLTLAVNGDHFDFPFNGDNGDGPEHFSGENCGTGAGGFQKGNTCQNGERSEVAKSAPSGWGDIDDSDEESASRKSKSIDKYANISKENGFHFVKEGSGFYEKAFGPGRAGTAIASFFANQNAIVFNEKNQYFDDPAGFMEKMGGTGWFSTSHPDHIVIHEIGHGKHHRDIGEERYREIKGQQVPEDVVALVRSEVSRYAAKNNPLEIVAEMYTAMSLGNKKFSDKLMNYYKSLGGPDVKESTK